MTAQDWRADAACAQIGGNLWYPEKGEPTRDAKRICAGCPVRSDCLDYALAIEATTGRGWVGRYGVWGGLTAQERKALTRREGNA